MTQPQAIAVVSEPVKSDEPKLDQFGRDAAERTVELSSMQAEAIDQEVTNGRWQTYDDALQHVINRGLAEIKRTREAARVLALAKATESKRKNYKALIQSNPALAVNAEFVATMMKDLGITK
jgi:hypothetical protein